jgi:DNA-binding transcriptional ArsR family regulator
VILGEATPVVFHLMEWSDALPIDAFRPDVPPPGQPLWILKRSTAADRARIRARGESFVAMDGAVRIQAAGLLVDRNDLEPPSPGPSGSRRTAFSDRASLIPRELFAAGSEQVWTVSSLAEASGVSLSVASYALQDLEARGLINVKKRGKRKQISMADRRALVEAWSLDYDWRDNHILPVEGPVESIRRFLFRLRGELSDTRWAVTLHSGERVLAAGSAAETIHIYFDLPSEADLWHLARSLGWRHAVGGSLRLMLPHYRRSVWNRLSDVQGVPVVSSLQLILDLWSHPNRGRTVAEALLENTP